MSKIQQIHSMTDIKALLAAATAMKIQELESLMRELNGVLHQKKSKDKTYREKELLRLINEAILDKEKRERYWQLALQLEEGTMPAAEHAEFMQLVEQDEGEAAHRTGAIAEYAAAATNGGNGAKLTQPWLNRIFRQRCRNLFAKEQ